MEPNFSSQWDGILKRVVGPDFFGQWDQNFRSTLVYDKKTRVIAMGFPSFFFVKTNAIWSATAYSVGKSIEYIQLVCSQWVNTPYITATPTCGGIPLSATCGRAGWELVAPHQKNRI